MLHRPAAALTLSQGEAVVAVLIGALAVDGVLGTDEARRLNEVLATTRWVLGLGAAAAPSATKRALDAISEHGFPAVLQACAAAIPADLRATTFALAIDLVLADGRLGSRESTFIDQLQGVLQIEDELARTLSTCCSSRTVRADGLTRSVPRS
jgi:hypothetical protein